MTNRFLTILICLGLPGWAMAQVSIKCNPGGLLFDQGSASIEVFPAYRIALQADAYWINAAERKSVAFSGYGAGISARYYLGTERRPSGLFLSPMAARQWLRFSDARSVDFEYSCTMLGAQAGYQREFFQVLVLEIGGGGWKGVGIPEFPQARGVNELYGEKFNWWLNISVGFVLWKPQE